MFKRMLIVEQNSAYANKVTELMAGLADDVEMCFDGKEALRRYIDFKPDIIFVEAILPEWDGFAILEKILDDDIIKIMLTAINRTALNKKAFDLKADYIFIKPYENESFAQRVCEVAELHWHRSQSPWDFIEEGNPRTRIGISSLLKELGVSPGKKGYMYLREAIMIACGKYPSVGPIKSNIYTPLASVFKTLPQLIERDIRHAIEAAVSRANDSAYYSCFGYSLDSEKGKPTNTEFIMAVTDKVLLELVAEGHQ